MAICTYLTDWEIKNFTTVKDKDLNELFQEVRTIFNGKYYIQEREYTVKGWFKKTKTETLYSLYKETFLPEVQQINFYVGNESSINTYVSKALLMATFYGLINGYNFNNVMTMKITEQLQLMTGKYNGAKELLKQIKDNQPS